MDKTRKIAVGCFISGALTMAVALALTPEYWWFGLAAGVASGYVGYEFREVLRAIPIAYRRAAAWQPDRLFWWSAFLTFAAPAVISFHLTAFVFVVMFFSGDLTANWPEVLKIISGFIVIISCLISLNWMVDEMNDSSRFPNIKRRWRQHIEFRKDLIFDLNPFSFWFYLMPKGIGWLVVRIPSGAVLAVPASARAARASIRFGWHLFRLIHSKERVLCAIDGTLGGAVSYVWLVRADMTLSEQAALIVFGGLMGAAFGVANWEIVSKRLLHLPEVQPGQPAV